MMPGTRYAKAIMIAVTAIIVFGLVPRGRRLSDDLVIGRRRG
jgi:hypothetical protein